ncbi:MAG: hypothetical protein AAGK14_14740 [Verrucomicrobiota bacterium]
MQNSELFRRGVVLPLNQEAENSLKANKVEEETSVRYLEIGDQDEFEAIWKARLFERINARTNGLIDDYEEYFVEAASMPAVLEAIEETRSENSTNCSEIDNFLTALSSLASEAALLERPLLFVL